VQDHHFVDQFLGRIALGKRLVEVADVGLGVAEMVAGSSSRESGRLWPATTILGWSASILLDTGDPLHSLLVVGLREPLVDAVVGDVAGDDGFQAGDVDDGRGVVSDCPTVMMSSSWPSGRSHLCPGLGERLDAREPDQGRACFQNCIPRAGLPCTSGTTAAAVTARALGNAWRMLFRPKKWSPWPWVM